MNNKKIQNSKGISKKKTRKRGLKDFNINKCTSNEYWLYTQLKNVRESRNRYVLYIDNYNRVIKY